MTRFEKLKARLRRRKPPARNPYALTSWIVEREARKRGEDPEAALRRAKEK